MEKAHLRDPADAGHEISVLAVQTMQPVEKPGTHPVQMPAHIFVREDVQRRPGRRERHRFGGQRGRDPRAGDACHEVGASTHDGERKSVGDGLP